MTTSTVSFEGVKQAVFFPFRGEKWGIKVLIGSALTFGSFIIPIIPVLPVFGYFGQIMKGIIIQEQDPEMPAWNDWGTLFLDGLKLLGAVIIYLLPALILGIGGYALFMASGFLHGLFSRHIGANFCQSIPPGNDRQHLRDVRRHGGYDAGDCPGCGHHHHPASGAGEYAGQGEIRGGLPLRRNGGRY